MKVKKDGKLGNPQNWKTTISCRKKDKFDSKGCSASLEIEAKDLVLMYFKGTHFRHHYSAVKCPQCGKYNRVRNIPQPIWEKLNTEKNQLKAIFDGFSESVV